MICSRNFLTGFQIRVITTLFSTAIVQNTTSFGVYLHLLILFTTLNSIVALMYFRLHIHKLRCSIISTALVSETTNIISCDAPTPKLWFSLLTFITYLGQLQFETSSGYPGNCNRVAG